MRRCVKLLFASWALLAAACTNEEPVLLPSDDPNNNEQDDPEKPKDDPEIPDDPTPPLVEPVTEFQLNTLIQTQYQHGVGSDIFYLALATSETTFDEELFTFRTADEGYVMNICLFTLPADDPTHPLLPTGRYPLNATAAAGTWSANPDQNMLVSYTQQGGALLEIPTEGELEVSLEGDQYLLTADFKVGEKSYKATWQGAIAFSGIPSDITEAKELELIGGQALYQGLDTEYKELGFVQLELWDSEPDSELGRVNGHFLKLKLYTEILTPSFMGVPAGTYTVGALPAPFAAAPGYDDGINIPTGCYISERTNGELHLAMIASGTIEVSADGCVKLDLLTDGEVSVKGELNTPMDLIDLTSGFGPSTGELSTLTGDVSFDFGPETDALMLDYGDFYGNGTRNVVIQILDEQTLTGVVVDLILPAAERYAPIPDGTFVADKGYHNTFTFAPGTQQMGQPAGSYYCNFELSDYYIGNIYAPMDDGTIVVQQNSDGTYTITVDVLDDAKTPHAIRGLFTGAIGNYE